MAKKKEQYDPTPMIELMDEIEYDLIYKLEICVNNGILLESDNKTLLQLDNKSICYPKTAYDSYSIIKFDPFFNRKLAQFLFQRYACIFMKEHPGFTINSFWTASNLLCLNETFAVCRLMKDGYSSPWKDMQSNAFVNETVAWIDLIYAMDACRYSYPQMYELDNAITYIKTMGVPSNDESANNPQ